MHSRISKLGLRFNLILNVDVSKLANLVATPCKSEQVTYPKQHKSFFWDDVMARSNCTYNQLDVTPFNFRSASLSREKRNGDNAKATTVIMSSKLFAVLLVSLYLTRKPCCRREPRDAAVNSDRYRVRWHFAGAISVSRMQSVSGCTVYA